jgi:hypothetical protein
MLIDFFIIGTQKGGTTALHSILKSIDGIEVPTTKEVHFFDNESTNWHQPDYKILHKHFNWENKDVIRDEATPIYSYWAPSIERIHAYNPDAKIIMLLRHPAYRAHSHWCMEFQRGKETLQFSDAISERGQSRVLSHFGSGHGVENFGVMGTGSAAANPSRATVAGHPHPRYRAVVATVFFSKWQIRIF